MTKRRSGIDIKQLKLAASSRWGEILNRVGGIPAEILDGNHHACPKCGGVDRFRMIDESVGAVLCNQCHNKKNGDGIAAVQWAADIDFKEATKRIADHLGVDVAVHKSNGKAARKKKEGPDKNPAKDLKFQKWSSALVAHYLKRKPGITEASLLAAGAKLASYQKHTVIAFPIIGETLDVAKPVGWVVVNCVGETLPEWSKALKKVVGQVKVKITYGSKAGLVGVHAIEKLNSDDQGRDEPNDDKPASIIWKVEGISDMLALQAAIPKDEQDRHLVVSNSNGTGEKPKKWQAELLAKCPAVAVIHDADEPGQAGASKWAGAIAAHQADGLETRIVQLPYEVTETKGRDLRDWLSEGNSYGDLLSLAKEAKPVEAEEDYEDDDEEIEKPDAKDVDPSAEAEFILGENKKDDVARLRFWQGNWWRWSEGRYRQLANEEVRALVINSMNDRWSRVKARHATDVLDQMRAKSILRSTTEPPAWLAQHSGFEDFDPNECLAMQNEVVHLPSLIDQREVFSAPASPSFFATNACEFDLDPQSPLPETWLKFLASLWVDDPESIDCLQEWFGYLLMPDTSQQKILMVLGPARSGKGTIARVLRELVGSGNVAAPTLGSLTANFGLQPLIGKSVAIISDARLSGRTDQVVVVERLLSISGEDAQTIDRKHQAAITCKLPTRFVILTNEMPRMNDASGAVISRMVLLRTTRSFLGHEDHNLTDKLLAELPGILLWAAGGLHRLRQRGFFSQPGSASDDLEEMNDLASPITVFVRDCCEIGETKEVLISEFFAAWAGWSKTQNREKFMGTPQSVGRDLKAAIASVERKQRRVNGKVVGIYLGIGLKAGF